MGEPERAGSDDVQLQKAVQVLVSNCREDSRPLIESGHQHLDRETILRLSRRTPERQRYELGQLRQGRRPFSTKSVVFDTISFGKVPSRLARASGKVNKAHVMIARWVTSGKQVTINQTAALVNAIRPYIRDCGDLWKLIRNGSWDANNAKGRRGKARPPKDESDWSHLAIAQCSPQKALACLAYRTFVAKMPPRPTTGTASGSHPAAGAFVRRVVVRHDLAPQGDGAGDCQPCSSHPCTRPTEAGRNARSPGC